MNVKDAEELIDTYFPQIEVFYTGFNQILETKDRDPDVPDLALIVPNEILNRYSAIKGLQKIPRDDTFLKETKLLEKLSAYKGNIPNQHLSLALILGFLKGNVRFDYEELDSGRAMLFIYEF